MFKYIVINNTFCLFVCVCVSLNMYSWHCIKNIPILGGRTLQTTLNLAPKGKQVWFYTSQVLSLTSTKFCVLHQPSSVSHIIQVVCVTSAGLDVLGQLILCVTPAKVMVLFQPSCVSYIDQVLCFTSIKLCVLHWPNSVLHQPSCVSYIDQVLHFTSTIDQVLFYINQVVSSIDQVVCFTSTKLCVFHQQSSVFYID